MKKPLIFLFLLLFALIGAEAQVSKVSVTDQKLLRKKEDSLKLLARTLIVDTLPNMRMRADSQFIKTLVRALKLKNSFYYPFDSVKGIGNIYAPDSTFRIFTWQLSFDDYYVRQRGAIQYRTPDGSLKLVPLRDYSEFTDFPVDSARSKDNWIGAVYYNMVKTQHNGKNYYTLFGFDLNGPRSNMKWIEVLSFDKQNLPVFGGRFSYERDSVKKAATVRYNAEYKKQASMLINYDDELQMILVDHLVPDGPQEEGMEVEDAAYNYVPDGDYEGFKWENGKWVHIEKVFHERLEDGQAPVPEPLRDRSGNTNQQKLDEKSQKNSTKKKDN